MESNPWDLRFVNCDSSKIEQQWIIFKKENGHNHIRLCQRSNAPRLKDNCLTAHYLMDDYVRNMFPQEYITPIKPNKEARYLKIVGYKQEDLSQQWQMNSTTHQLANVKYPKICITTSNFFDLDQTLLVECNGYGYESPNPHLTNKHHQRFIFMPALDKNGEQLCSD